MQRNLKKEQVLSPVCFRHCLPLSGFSTLFITTVCLTMPSQMSIPRKGSGAKVALEGLFPRVRSIVLDQDMMPSKGSGAQLTLVRPLTSVCSIMGPQRGTPSKGLRAKIALVRFITIVCSIMRL